MKRKTSLKKASKAHQKYKLKDGTIVVGCTTVVGLLNKPYLVKWANNLGLEGIDSSKYRDQAAEAGTLAHELIVGYLNDEPVNIDTYSPMIVSLAENSFKSFLEWEKGHELEIIFCEKSLVHEELKFGGTVDCLCRLDGKLTLLDFKTGKAIYDEYFVQLAGYREALKYHGYEVEQCRILRIGRDESEGFEDRTVGSIDTYWNIFKHLLEIYYLKKEVNWK